MFRRKGRPIDLVWVHLNLSNLRANDFLADAQAKVNERIPEAQLSVARNLANTEALVKVTATLAEIQALPNPVRNAIIRIYTESDHDEAVALVHGPTWPQPVDI